VIQRKVTGSVDPSTLSVLAVFEHYGGNYNAAENLYREVLDNDRKTLGDRHTDVGLGMQNLAFLLHDQGNDREAEKLLREAVSIQREQLGESHRGVAVPLAHLATTLVMQDQEQEGEHLFQEALAIEPDLLTESGPQRAEMRSVYGVLMTRVGRYEEAEPLLLGGLETLSTRLGPEDERTRRAVSRLIDLYEAWGKPKKAAEYRALLKEAEPQ
jgi:tetratricopeptide (TPR) repeat protein